MNIIKNYFEKIKNLLGGSFGGDNDIIDFENGRSISLKEVEEEYYKYKDLEQMIDDYIDENNLDSVDNYKQIIEHFKNEINEDLFLYNQGFLKDFEDYMIEKLKEVK